MFLATFGFLPMMTITMTTTIIPTDTRNQTTAMRLPGVLSHSFKRKQHIENANVAYTTNTPPFCSGLWGTASIFIWYILCSGKFDQMRRELDGEQTIPPEATAAIEMGEFNGSPAAGVATAVMVPAEEARKLYPNNV